MKITWNSPSKGSPQGSPQQQLRLKGLAAQRSAGAPSGITRNAGAAEGAVQHLRDAGAPKLALCGAKAQGEPWGKYDTFMGFEHIYS